MEFEQMREVLARGMGWTECLCRRTYGVPEVGWKTDDYGRIVAQVDWRPDEKPEQMMKVIDSLDKDWLLHVWIDEGGQNWTCEAAHGDFKEFGFGKFCEAICRAIAHIKELEATDETSR